MRQMPCSCKSQVSCMVCLQDMIGDANPMVVANAVAALSEIQEISGKAVFVIDSNSLFKLLRALNECTEWGQVGGEVQAGWDVGKRGGCRLSYPASSLASGAA